MWKLWGIFLFAMTMAMLSEYCSTYRRDKFGMKKYKYKEKVFYIIMIVVMSVFVGLRTSYNDTWTYRQNYGLFTTTSFSDVDMSLGENPGFNIVNTFLKIIGASSQDLLMLYALITVPIYLWFIRKYTENIPLTVFLFFTMGCYTFTMAAIKQCVAVAFGLIGVDRAIRGKWIGFVFWILLGATFHPYVLMYLAIPLLMHAPWTDRTYWVLAICGIAGVGLEAMLGTIVDITTMMGESYDASSFNGEGVNLFRVLVVWVPVVISFFTAKFWKKSKDTASNLIMNLSMLNAEIMFIGLFGTANYFGRLANYFLIFQTISLPQLLKYFNTKSKKLLLVGAVVGYLLYFSYANALDHPFDMEFYRIGFWKYLKTKLWFL